MKINPERKCGYLEGEWLTNSRILFLDPNGR